MPDGYDLEEHRHRFAYWAAARAAFIHPEKGLTVSVAKDALEKSLRAIALDPDSWPTKASVVDNELKKWTTEVHTSLSQVSPGVKYGRAAKLVAVYLKDMVVTGPLADHDFAKLLHPPIDKNLLEGLKKGLGQGSLFRDGVSPDSQARVRVALSNTLTKRWSRLEPNEYCELISAFRDAHLDRDERDQPAFWHLERHWRPDREP